MYGCSLREIGGSNSGAEEALPLQAFSPLGATVAGMASSEDFWTGTEVKRWGGIIAHIPPESDAAEIMQALSPGRRLLS